MPPRTPVEVQPPPGPRLADWNLLRSFIAVFETGTLTEAARRLGATQPSMGRHLRELEAEVGETLFVRLPGRLEPTDRARTLYESIEPMQRSVREAERQFTEAREQIVGVVRVAVSEAYAYHVVPPMLGPLLVEQPELEIELSVSNRADNLLRREADIAVRFFRPRQDGLIARKLGEAELGLYAHEGFIKRHGMPKDFSMPAGAFVTGFDREEVPLAPALRGAPPTQPLRFRFRSDSVLSHQSMVECGAGIGMYFTHIAAQRPGLRRVLADRVSLPQEVWLCAHDELRRSSRMRYVWERLGFALEECLRV
jgi:DNA-binding transcriptional LysR family regulator